LQALRQAYGRQQPEGTVLHHSDRGSQYASYEYQKQLRIYSMTSSMSRKGNYYDNACIESFHSIIIMPASSAFMEIGELMLAIENSENIERHPCDFHDKQSV
jgi:transposase InsO family protein